MPLTRNKRKRKIRSIRKTRGRKIKRNHRNKRKLSRKGRKKNNKTKKRNRMGKGVDEEQELKKLSRVILKTEARNVKSKIKEWVVDFKDKNGREPNDIDKRAIHDKYVKFRNLKNIYENKKICIFCYELLETKPIIKVGCSKKCRFHEECFINWCNEKGIVEICPKCQNEIQNKCPNNNEHNSETSSIASDDWYALHHGRIPRNRTQR